MYKKIYVDKQIVEDNPLMIIGRVTHEAIATYNKHCLDNKIEHDFSKWKECAYLALEQANLDAEHYPSVLEMVKNYADSHTIALESAVGAEEEIAITKDFKECEWGSQDAWFRSVIDYLQIAGDVAKITDYKAGWLLTAPKLQFKIYAWILSKIYPHVSVFEVELDFVRHEYQENFTIEVDELKDIEREILSKTNKIEKDTEFKPAISIACSYCGCWSWCPAMKQEDVVFKMPTSDVEAVEIGLKLEKFSKLKDEAQKILKKYCDAQGDLIAGGRKYGFNVSSSWQFEDVATLIAKANDAGVDVFDALTVNNLKLKKLMHSQSVKTLIESLGKKKVTVSFSSKKYKPQDDLAPEEKEEKEEDSKDV